MKIFLMDTNAARELLFVQGTRAKAELKPIVGNIDIHADIDTEDLVKDLKRYFKATDDDGMLNSFDDMPGTECQYEDILEGCEAEYDPITLTLLFDDKEDN